MHIPAATYRLQLSPAFGFEDAKAVIGYLSELGISDLYVSPILKATQGSTHGYDVTGPDELNPELGTWEQFQSLAAEVRARHMGWVQDIVPNHMAYSSQNGMLMDVLEHGPDSAFHEFFDVFRDHPGPELRTKVLAPFLARPLAEALRRGEIRLVLDRDGFGVRYEAWRFPLCVRSYPAVLQGDRDRPGESQSGGHRRPYILMRVSDLFARRGGRENRTEGPAEFNEAKRTLLRLYDQDPQVRADIDETLQWFNRPVQGGVEQSPLFRLLDEQFFKLVFWQDAQETINYRRFFYLSDFIALRMEDPKVFQHTHRKILQLARAGVITGLRIDHIDGLYDPRGYLNRLRETLPQIYLVIEKILELDETLPTDWPIQGTSGYEFCNYVNALFCRQENERTLTQTYHEFIGTELDYASLLYEAKRETLEQHMAGEVTYLAHLFARASTDDSLQDAESTRQALTAVIAALPVYRTYVDAHHFAESDKAYVTAAVDEAKKRAADCARHIDRIGQLLLADWQDAPDRRTREAWQHVRMRFQQFTGPAMAKGFEDTLLYRYNRLLSLNTVGGNPNTLGLSLDRFHRFNQARARDWPQAMNATSTHDSKRAEDVRARINVLSEIPERWRNAVTRWADLNEPHKQRDNGLSIPDRNDEYLLYQTLVGALPFDECQYDRFTRRIKDYMTKAVREAKVHSTWEQPNVAYEAACLQFVDRVLDRSEANRFWADFVPFQREVSEYGIYNSLSQTILKITCPGLPDFYQGTETWDLNLVDPDNRRPVDFARRAGLLKELQETSANGCAQLARELMDSKQDGRIKLFLVHRGLQARRENQDLFQAGDYLPASVTGACVRHIVAFFRVWHDRYALIVAPRFLTPLIEPGRFPMGRQVWEDTRIGLPSKAPWQWRDAITGKTYSARGETFIGDILSDFPVSILLSGPTTVGA